MIMRVVRLINNFYKDQEQSGKQEPLGDFCAFGYYDAVQAERATRLQNLTDRQIWKTTAKVCREHLNGMNEQRNLVCLITDELVRMESREVRLGELERQFWEDQENQSYPYLFISMIRTKKDPESLKHTEVCIKEQCIKEKTFAYFTNDHQEMIIFRRAESYGEGMRFIRKLRGEIGILKIYTVFSVRESFINNKENCKKYIRDEKVRCCMRASAKNIDEVPMFIDSLVKTLRQDKTCDEQKKISVSCADILGNSDILMEIREISLRDLLPCFAMGSILTHSNPLYSRVFYNIETEIFLVGENKDDESKCGE